MQARWSDPRAFAISHTLFQDHEKVRARNRSLRLYITGSNDQDTQYVLATKDTAEGFRSRSIF
jgi:hypothetical protein